MSDVQTASQLSLFWYMEEGRIFGSARRRKIVTKAVRLKPNRQKWCDDNLVQDGGWAENAGTSADHARARVYTFLLDLNTDLYKEADNSVMVCILNFPAVGAV